MTAADAIKDLLAPLLPSWSLQFGHWTDPGGAVRSAVLKPAGGPRAELLRKPTFTLTLIGLAGGDGTATAETADTLVDFIRSNSGSLVYLEASEPTYTPTADGRPVFEIALSAIAT